MISNVITVNLPGKVMWWSSRIKGESISACLQCRMCLFLLAGVVSSVGCCLAARLPNAKHGMSCKLICS
jgi:hypothetical protein